MSNNITLDTSKQTPIEIALGIDEKGRTTAKRLYAFLELRQGDYSRWCKINILENAFAEENVDYEVLRIDAENPQGGRPSQDYKLTAPFAKKLAMMCHNERGEEARKYFITVEDKLKEVVQKVPRMITETEQEKIKAQLAEAKLRNARAREASMWLKIADKVDSDSYKHICASYASGVLNGSGNVIPLPNLKNKTYSATEIGQQLGINKKTVGSLANKYNLKTDKYGEWFKDKATGTEKEVEVFRYYENVIPVLKQILGNPEIA